MLFGTIFHQFGDNVHFDLSATRVAGGAGGAFLVFAHEGVVLAAFTDAHACNGEGIGAVKLWVFDVGLRFGWRHHHGLPEFGFRFLVLVDYLFFGLAKTHRS